MLAALLQLLALGAIVYVVWRLVWRPSPGITRRNWRGEPIDPYTYDDDLPNNRL